MMNNDEITGDFAEIISMMRNLVNVKIDNQPDMERCIKNLHELGRIFHLYLNHMEHLAPLFNIFNYHLSMLTRHEGSTFILADISKKICIRMVPLFVGFINDYYWFIDEYADLSEDFKELIKS